MRSPSTMASTYEEVISEFLVLKALVKRACDFEERFLESSLGSKGDLITHEDSNRVHPLPSIAQGLKASNFEVPGRDVEPLGELGPLAQVICNLQTLVAVVDNQEITAAGGIRHLPTTLMRILH